MYPQFTAHTHGEPCHFLPLKARLWAWSCRYLVRGVDKTHANEKTSIPGVSTSHPASVEGVSRHLISWGEEECDEAGGKNDKAGDKWNVLYSLVNCTHALVLINTLHARSSFQIWERGKGEGEGQRFELFLASFSETQRCELHPSLTLPRTSSQG